LFSYLHIVLVLGVFQGLCGVGIINVYVSWVVKEDFEGDTGSVRGSPGTLIPDILAVKPKASQSTNSMICGP
jgi:hypothetical protein